MGATIMIFTVTRIHPLHQWGSQASDDTLTGAEIAMQSESDRGFAELFWLYKGDAKTVQAVLQEYVVGHTIDLPLDQIKLSSAKPTVYQGAPVPTVTEQIQVEKVKARVRKGLTPVPDNTSQ